MKTLLIGIGNEFRRDDGVGPAVARWMAEKPIPDVKVIEQPGDGAALMEAWKDAERVYLVDAVSSAGVPGTIYRINAHEQPLPLRFFSYSTHAFSVAEAVEMARTLGELPLELIIFGIEGGNFNAGTGLTPEVNHAARIVVGNIINELIDK